jgi:hypothetical protein
VNWKFGLSVAAYAVPTFPLGYFWHLVTFHEAYQRLQIYRDDILIPFGLASMLIQAVVYAWLYPRLFDTRRDRWLRSALRFGAIFGAFQWSLTVLPVAAKHVMASVPTFMMLETGFTLLQFGVVAPLIALARRDAA